MGLKIFEFILAIILIGIGIATGNPWFIGIGAAALSESLVHLHAKVTGQTPANTQNTIPVVYGKAKVGATVIDMRQETSNENLYVVGALCHGSQNGEGIEDFHEMQLDGIDWVIDGAPDLRPDGGYIRDEPWQTSFFANHADYGRHDGAGSQPVDQTLTGVFSTAWPSTSRLAGIAYIIGRFDDTGLEEGVFVGFPQMSAVVSGVKVLDTRTSTWGWSDNPALCIYDHLTSPIYGAGIPASRIDTTSFDDAADYCEVTVTHPDTTRDRYTCNGVIDTALPLSRRFEQLLSSCNGALVYEGGLFRLVIRQTQAAESFTADGDMIVGGIKWRKPGIKDTGNQVLATFVNADLGYALDTVQWPEAGSTTTLTYLTEDDDRAAPVAVELGFTTNQYTALDIASIRLKELRGGDALTFTMREQAIQYHAGDVITVDHPLLGADGPMDVWVLAMKPAANQQGQVSVDCLEYQAAAYTLPTHSTIATPPAADPPDRARLLQVTNLSVTSIFSCIAPTQSSITLRATWTLPVGPLWGYHTEYREQGATDWIRGPDVGPGLSQADIVIGAVTGQTYEVGITVLTVYRAKGARVTTTVDLGTSGRSVPDGSQITGGDITVTQAGNQVRLDVDTISSNGTIIEWNASATAGFTPGPTNLLAQAHVTAGSTVTLFGTPPGNAGDTVYYRIGVKDCLSDSIGEAASYSAEFSFVYGGPTSVGQQIGHVDHGTQTGTYDIDWRDGTSHEITVGASALTITFSGYDEGMYINLLIIGGVGALTLPATNYAPGGTTPTGPASSERDRYGYIADGSAGLSNIDGHKVGDDYS